MTLAELTALFRRLGATDAINLDGGGSTALAIRGEVQNRPSDREGERAVGNALALVGCNGKE
jgi:exopolysaccharide biosynthesis protein